MFVIGDARRQSPSLGLHRSVDVLDCERGVIEAGRIIRIDERGGIAERLQPLPMYWR